jgi:SAM-dependent methyltransferase
MAPTDTRLDVWLAEPLGGLLLREECAAVAASLECAFGLHCLQVGDWGGPDAFLASARTRRASWVSGRAARGAALVADPAELPLQSDSVDVMLLPHTLEFAPNPHEVLRESARVLAGEGELLIVGFEPLGAWALRNRFTRGGSPPGIVRTLPAARVSEWLKLVGFEAGPPGRFLYVPPLAGLANGRLRGFFERAGRRGWPRFSGAYLLHARKRVQSMTPVRLRQRTRTAVIGGLAEPAARRVS